MCSLPRSRAIHLSWWIAVVTFLVFFSQRAMALDTPSGEGTALATAVDMAIRTNPSLIGHQFAVTEAVARRDHAALRPPITLGADVENVLGTGRVGAADNLEATLRLSTVIELGAKRALRMQAAERNIAAVSAQRDIQALDLLSNVTRRFIANLAFQAKVDIADEHVRHAKAVVEAVRTRLHAGFGSPVEEGNAVIHLQQMEIALNAAKADLRRSWGALASTWGAPPDGNGRAVGDLFALPPLSTFAAFAEKVDRNPYVARFAAERTAAEARARLARAGRTPDVTVSAGVRRLEAFHDQAFVFGVSVPLGSGGRNAPAEREANAAASQAAYTEAAAKNDNMATLYGLYEQAAQARDTFLTLRERQRRLPRRALFVVRGIHGPGTTP
jgi:cobalt-zinc-cadmium efflux system outer membrane protein